MVDDSFEGPGPASLPAPVAARLRARNERLAHRTFASNSSYLARSLNEQHHARRTARRLGLRSDEVEAVVRWHLEDFVSRTRPARHPARPPVTYGVVLRPRSRRARLLHVARRSPLVSWIPSFTSNRIVEVRAMFLRLGDFGRSRPTKGSGPTS